MNKHKLNNTCIPNARIFCWLVVIRIRLMKFFFLLIKNGFPKGITLYLLMVCSTTSRNKQYTVTSLLATIRTGGQASSLSALSLFQDSSLMLN